MWMTSCLPCALFPTQPAAINKKKLWHLTPTSLWLWKWNNLQGPTGGAERKRKTYINWQIYNILSSGGYRPLPSRGTHSALQELERRIVQELLRRDHVLELLGVHGVAYLLERQRHAASRAHGAFEIKIVRCDPPRTTFSFWDSAFVDIRCTRTLSLHLVNRRPSQLPRSPTFSSH